MTGQPGFFDLDERYADLSKTGDPLERLASVVDFEVFRPELDRPLGRSERSNRGRPPMDAVLMLTRARPLTGTRFWCSRHFMGCPTNRRNSRSGIA